MDANKINRCIKIRKYSIFNEVRNRVHLKNGGGKQDAAICIESAEIRSTARRL